LSVRSIPDRISRRKVSPEQNGRSNSTSCSWNDYHGDSELGTLFIERKARGGGALRPRRLRVSCDRG
jgi:hypothetical protein